MWFNDGMVPGDGRSSEDGRTSYYLNHYLSTEYKRDWLGKRPPIFVVLPNGDFFCVDSCAQGSPNGWTVTGEAPNITVTPSIHVLNGDNSTRWHGFLTSGELA